MRSVQKFNGKIEVGGIDLVGTLGEVAIPEFTGEGVPNIESSDSLATVLSKQQNINGKLGDLAYTNATALIEVILSVFYPVGSIKITTDNVNPSIYMGGTWVAWGAGRVPVGVDTAQTEFDTVEETGGEKTHTLTVAEMPEHNHDPFYALSEGEDYLKMKLNSSPGTSYTVLSTEQIGSGSIGLLLTVGEGAAHNNLQPYITCYMWKRTE